MANQNVAFVMQASEFADALRRTRIAVSSEETRYYLCGVYMHAFEGKIRFVSTDGHQMQVVTTSVDAPAGMPGFIIPRDFVVVALKECGARKCRLWDANFILANGTLRIDIGVETIETKGVDGTFPDYQRLVPRNFEYKFSMERESLLASLQALAGFLKSADRFGPRVKFVFRDNKVTLSANLDYLGEAVCKLEAGCNGMEGVFEIGFNVEYVCALVKSFASEIVHFHTDYYATSPVRIDGEEHAFAILMPQRL